MPTAASAPAADRPGLPWLSRLGLVAAAGCADVAPVWAQEERISALPAVNLTATLPTRLEAVPGSSTVVTERQLPAERPYSIREALQGVPGLHVVGEDAFGLNLNIGIRGLDPRRTSRTLLLEDGMPIHLAPYSDPSAHYATPLERIQRIEVIKGSGQIVHGPQTVGGVINFVTREVPTRFAASGELTVGNRRFGRVAASVGSGSERGGWRVEAAQRQGRGSREGHDHRLRDVAVKGRVQLGASQSLGIKLGHTTEDSSFGEAGIDQARFDADPTVNPFRNDVFELRRSAVQVVHRAELTPAAQLSTQVYWSRTERASYRQLDAISEDGELETLRRRVGPSGTPNIPGCPADIDFTVPNGFEQFAGVCGNNQRPRSYQLRGIEPRLSLRFDGFGWRHELIAGVRVHDEDIRRRRFNGATPTAREGSPGSLLRDDFQIRTRAVAAYVQNTVIGGNWSITPGVRYESYQQTNGVTRLDFAPFVASVTQRNRELLPGLGLTYFGLPGTTVFAGVHRGIAPPRPDVNLTPADPDYRRVDPELSTNLELGLRSSGGRGLAWEATLFRIDFENQIVPGAAVGSPQTYANAGKTLNQGLELAGRADFGRRAGLADNPYLGLSLTHLGTARFDSDLDSDGTNVRGKRLPYAPKQLFSLSAGYESAAGWDVRIGLTRVSSQYTDAVNTVAASADGQSGVIPAYTLVNASVNLRLRPHGLTVYLAATNLGDKRYLVGRVNGAQVGAPRQIQAGLRWAL